MTFYRMFYPRQTCYLGTSYENKPNVTVVDWVMPVSVKPPMMAVALNNASHSLDLLSRSKEFTLNIMPEKCAEQAMQVGATTGRLIDKVDEYAVAMRKGKRIDAPLMKEAIGSVECKVVQIMNSGDHSVVVGEVVEMHFPDDEGEKIPMLFNFGNKAYFGLARGMEKKLKEFNAGMNSDEKRDQKLFEASKKPDEKKENGEKKAEEKKETKGEEKKEPKGEEKKEAKSEEKKETADKKENGEKKSEEKK